jgi:hypothetical protein
MPANPMNTFTLALGACTVVVTVSKELYVSHAVYTNPYPVPFTLQVVAPEKGERYNFALEPFSEEVQLEVVNLHAFDVFARIVYSRFA